MNEYQTSHGLTCHPWTCSDSALGAALQGLQPQLAPLLCTLMPRPQKLASIIPAKGKGKKGVAPPQAEATAKLVVGPMAQLPIELQVRGVYRRFRAGIGYADVYCTQW